MKSGDPGTALEPRPPEAGARGPAAVPHLSHVGRQLGRGAPVGVRSVEQEVDQRPAGPWGAAEVDESHVGGGRGAPSGGGGVELLQRGAHQQSLDGDPAVRGPSVPLPVRRLGKHRLLRPGRGQSGKLQRAGPAGQSQPPATLLPAGPLTEPWPSRGTGTEGALCSRGCPLPQSGPRPQGAGPHPVLVPRRHWGR